MGHRSDKAHTTGAGRRSRGAHSVEDGDTIIHSHRTYLMLTFAQQAVHTALPPLALVIFHAHKGSRGIVIFVSTPHFSLSKLTWYLAC